MKVRAYTIEWTERIEGNSHKHIVAFDDYGAARAKAIKLLKARTDCRRIWEQKELHFTAPNGVVYNRLKVKVGRYWYQVTIKFHPSEGTAEKFW